jgi:hypothetical protein
LRSAIAFVQCSVEGVLLGVCLAQRVGERLAGWPIPKGSRESPPVEDRSRLLTPALARGTLCIDFMK